MTPPTTLLLLFAGHALADFPLQGEYLALGKNRNLPQGKDIWPWCMTAHALIHAGIVTLLLGPWFGAAEFLVHWGLDYGKCEGRSTYGEDQFLHYLFKVLWLIISLSPRTF